MIKILHLSDIHMGSGFSHGRINPITGLNTRLEDFVNTLSQNVLISAIGQSPHSTNTEPVDLVICLGVMLFLTPPRRRMFSKPLLASFAAWLMPKFRQFY
jgi:hypothetical protein